MYRFTKALRLRKKQEYDSTLNAGRRRATPNLVVIAKGKTGDTARLGMIVSRKVGNAVVRNKVKRYIREVFRHTQATLPAWDIVVIARPAAKGAPLQQLATDFRVAIDKLRSKEQLKTVS